MSNDDDDKEKDIEKRISAVTSILFATTILSFFVLIILLFLRLTIYNFTKGSDNTIIKTGHSVYFYILVFMSIAFLFSLVSFIISSVYIYPDKYVKQSIGTIIDNYEDITTITIMQFVLLIVYKIMEHNNKVHEKFVLFMALFTIGIIRLLLLLSKSDWSFKNIDNRIKEEIRYSNGLKIYKCVDGEPTFTKNPVKCANDKPIYDLDILDDDNDDALTINFISPLDKIFTSNKINTFFWVKLYYIILVLVTVIGLFISIIQFVITYFGRMDCTVSDATEKKFGLLNKILELFYSGKKEISTEEQQS